MTPLVNYLMWDSQQSHLKNISCLHPIIFYASPLPTKPLLPRSVAMTMFEGAKQ